MQLQEGLIVFTDLLIDLEGIECKPVCVVLIQWAVHFRAAY